MSVCFYFILLGVSISAEVFTLIKDQKVTCVITEDSLYNAIEVVPWVELKRPVAIVEYGTLVNDWEFCNNTECVQTFDFITDQRWESMSVQCSELQLSDKSYEGAVKLKEYRQFLSLYSNGTTLIKASTQRFDASTNITFELSERKWSHFSFKRNGTYFEIIEDKKISKNVSLGFKPEWISFENTSNKTCRKLHKYKFIYSNSSAQSKIPIGLLKCVFMYVSVDENCILKVKFEKNGNSVNKTIEGFDQDKTLRKWRKFNITNNSDGPGYLYFLKDNGTSKTGCFWAVSEIQKCRNRTEFYSIDLRNDTQQQHNSQICRTVKGSYNKSTPQITFPNKVFDCFEVLGTSYPNCEKHKICFENETCSCVWGYKGTFCNETCQSGSWGLNCSNSCETNCGKCDPVIGCTKCKGNFTGDQCENNNTLSNTTQRTDKAETAFNDFPATKNVAIINSSTASQITSPKQEEKIGIVNTLVVAVSVTSFIVATSVTIIFTLWKCKRGQRRKLKMLPKREQLFESYILVKKDNQSNDSNLIELEKFEIYFLESLEEDPDNNQITQEYNAISKTPSKNRTIGQLPKNRDKNRYRNIIPYDDTRVILKNDDDESNYINANYIDGFNSPRSFIATQAPLPSTLFDFWLMIYQEKITTIIMLTKLTENGLVKCEQYWPEVQSRCRFGKFLIENVSEKVFPNYTVRQLQVLCDNQTHFLQHFQYVTWPDHGVPLYTQDYIRFLKKIMRLPQKAPIVVHCNAGCGRTGAFILSDIAVRMAIHENKVDFPKLLSQIRDQRQGLVSNVDQYIFVHTVILEYFFRKDFSIFVTNNYQYDVKKAMEKESLETLVEYLEKATIQLKKNRKKYNLQLTDEEKNKNRFPDLLPGHSRVFLPNHSSKYINAINVDCYLCPKKFIVTQQPLPNTVEDFWILIKEYDIDTIISLNEIPENDPDCPIFWPEDPYEAWLFGNDLKVTFQNESNNDLYKTVKVKFDVDRRAISVIDVKGWKRDSLTPKSVQDLICLWKKVVSGTNQIVVTCYDGNTASGLFVALVFLLEKLNMDHVCDVFSAVKTVRESRLEFVQHPDQLVFLYKAALEYIREFSTYRNFN